MRLAWLRRGLGGLLAATLIAAAARARRRPSSAACPLIARGAPAKRGGELGTNQMFLGPVVGSLGVYVGAQYNDNINSSQFARESDSILSGG